MLWKCYTQYASKFGKFSSGHRTGKGQFSFHSQRKAMQRNRGKQQNWKDYRDFFKKIGDIKRTFHTRMDMIKDRNGKDLTEAEEIKKRWQEY